MALFGDEPDRDDDEGESATAAPDPDELGDDPFLPEADALEQAREVAERQQHEPISRRYDVSEADEAEQAIAVPDDPEAY